MLVDFIFDFETRSRADLKNLGSVKYALDKTTEVTLLTYTFGSHSHIRYWLPWMPIPSDLLDVIRNPGKYHFVAWNIMFDYMIWTQVLRRQLPEIIFGDIPLANLTDAMALSNHFRTGSTLEAAAVMCGFHEGKDKIGKLIMQKMMKPGRDGNFYIPNNQELNFFIAYGIKDTQLLRDIYYMLLPLPSLERYAWEWTFRRNLSGLRLDIELLQVMDYIIKKETPSMEKRFMDITGYSPRSPKLIAYFKQWYPEINSLDAENMEDLLLDERPVPPYVRQALELKDLLGSSSISKIQVALNRHYGGYIYDILDYHKTQTKRWAGKGLQVQNFPRAAALKDMIDPFDFDLNDENIAFKVLEQYKRGLKDPVDFVKNLLRRIFPAYSPDHDIIAGDWSQIEPTVLFWLLDLGGLPDKWYEEMASEIYGLPISQIGKDSEERQIGKMANLSCGYGSGAKAFRKAVKKQAGLLISTELANRTIKAYRRKYHQVATFWIDLENAFIGAIRGQTISLCKGKLLFTPFQRGRLKGVKIRLPSGGELFYHNARVITVKDDKGKVKTTIAYDSYNAKGLETKYIYGGLICENVVSATARDIILPTIPRLEKEGFNVLNLIHDEIWGASLKGHEERFKALMCHRPTWCLDMEIKAETTTGARYLK